MKKVSPERWAAAQKWELANWKAQQNRSLLKKILLPAVRPVFRRLGIRRGEWDDWNFWWAHHFEEYRFLPDTIERYIEVGCGPYSNTRLIVPHRTVRCLVVSDPLIREYIRFRHGWIAEQYRKGTVIIDDHPLECCPFADDWFDTVVMINVLDHVMDADRCLANAVRITKTGGYLILGQDLTDPEDLKNRDPDHPVAVGHPLSLHEDDIKPYLRGFQPLITKYLPRDQGRAPHKHYATLIFAGIKT